MTEFSYEEDREHFGIGEGVRLGTAPTRDAGVTKLRLHPIIDEAEDDQKQVGTAAGAGQ